MNKKPYDEAYKFLSEQDAEALLILLGLIKPDEKAKIEKLPLELSVSTILADQAYLVTTKRGQSILHPEAQLEWKDELLTRMPDYDARFWMTYRLPVFSCVLLLTKKGLPKKLPPFAVVKAGGLEIKARLKVVKVWELSARRVLEMKRTFLLPYIALMRGGKNELEQGARLLREVKDERQRLNIGIHFLTLGGLRYNREDLLELIVRQSMIPLEQLKGSSIYQWIVEEGLKEGLEKGLKKGKLQGKREGKRESLVETLLLMIANRFPDLDVETEVKAIKDTALLQQFCLEVMNARSAKALKARLAKAPK